MDLFLEHLFPSKKELNKCIDIQYRLTFAFNYVEISDAAEPAH